MPRTKFTKSTKGEEGGGENLGKVVGEGISAKASARTGRRQERARPSEDEGGRIREERDFYRISRGLVRPTTGGGKAPRANPGDPGTDAKPENRVAKAVVDLAFQVHTALGPGLLESVYEVVMAHELRALGFRVERQVPIAIRYRDIVFEKAFLADLVVDGLVIVELKSVEELAPIHAKQLLTQIRLMQKRLGLLINFGSTQLKDNVRRLANGLDRPPDFSPPSL